MQNAVDDDLKLIVVDTVKNPIISNPQPVSVRHCLDFSAACRTRVIGKTINAFGYPPDVRCRQLMKSFRR